METNLTPVLDKVRKLLQLAKSDNANEAAAAMAKAQSLIEQHRLSVAELEASGDGDQESKTPTVVMVLEGVRLPIWQVRLIIILVEANGCDTWQGYAHKAGKVVSHYQVIGRASDVEAVKYLFAYSVSELTRLAKCCKGLGRSFHNAWYQGAVTGIKDQITVAKEIAHQEAHASTQALVLLDKRRTDAALAMRQLVPGLKTTPVRSGKLIGDAYRAGREAGRNMPMGRPDTTKQLT